MLPPGIKIGIRRNRGILLSASIVLVMFISIGSTFFYSSRSIMEQQLKDQLRDTASIGATLFAGEEIDLIRGIEDLQTPLFKSLVRRLNTVRSARGDLEYAYIMRRTDDPNTLVFVADAGSLNTLEEMDENNNGIIEESEEISLPGDEYDISDVPAMQHEAFVRPTSDEGITLDQWGAFISGYAPIMRQDGSVAGIIGIDMRADNFLARSQSIVSPGLMLLVLIVGAMAAVYVYITAVKRRVAVLQQLHDERSSILQLAMHQIGTPLTIFKWSMENVQDLLDAKECNPEDVSEHLTLVRQGASQLENVFNALVETSKVDDKSQHAQAESISIADVINDVERDLSEDFAERNHTLHQQVADDAIVYMDRKLCYGLLHELISNASEYSPEGAHVDVHAEHHKRHVRIDIIDHGCGIPAKDLERIFDRFVRGSNATLVKPSGNGLGLYVAKTITERSGGKIEVKSEQGAGTTITLFLPYGG